jgi:hypothetical protein
MARSLWLLSTTCLAALALAGCHVAGCREDDQACALLTDTADTGATTEPSTADPATTVDPTSASSEPETASETGTDTTGPPAVCGDGVVEGDEPCDDANDLSDDACLPGCVAARCGDGQVQAAVEECDDGDDDDSDECTGECTLPRCGDGHVQAPEVCDDGKANSDKIYGGCGSQCTPAPGCGDGVVNGPEVCDDGQNDDPSDGCLPGCVEATSCKQILENSPGAPSGKYRIYPVELGGNVDLQVMCDMESDGGGYTLLKVDTEVGLASDKGAKAAEAVCNSYGMHLLVPRTEAHLKYAYTAAIADNAPPVGGGSIGKGAEYLSILAIYPGMPGATCNEMGLNSDDCPDWKARDEQRFWVTKKVIPDEPSNEHCAGCSMFYKWNLDGSLKSYTTFPIGEGASSYRFFCDVADKY